MMKWMPLFMTTIFIDTGGFFAALIDKDPAHIHALPEMTKLKSGKSRWITTDYVLDETATLLRAKGFYSSAVQLLGLQQSSVVLKVAWIDTSRFENAYKIFTTYKDQNYSFTDCTSFAVMKELNIKSVLTTDRHFEYMGFKKIL